MEDLVVGLLVDAVGDLLVVLVAHAILVGGLVDLCELSLALVKSARSGLAEDRTGIDLLVGEALGLVIALESALGLVHESRHCGFGGGVVLVLDRFVMCDVCLLMSKRQLDLQRASIATYICSQGLLVRTISQRAPQRHRRLLYVALCESGCFI